MKLSVIIPVYNEEKTLREVLERVLRVELDKEILIVDDGSTDATRGVIAEYSNRPEVRGLFHERNRGKGAAIRTGIGHVAIGGITAGNIDQVLQAGARTVAVCSAVTTAPDPAAACRQLKERLARDDRP